MTKLLREPLVHFLALGGLLFGFFALAERRAEPPHPANRIFITPQLVQGLAVEFQRTSGRPPEAAEKQTLLEAYVREEVLVREARTRGLDRDDPVVRAQLRQRMEQLAESNLPATSSVAQRQTALDSAYQQMRSHYEIVIEPPAGPARKSP